MAERAAALAELHGAARELAGWPESLEPVEFACADHSELFGLARVPAGGVVELGGLTAGAEVVGEVVAGAGADVYLRLRSDGADGEGSAAGAGGPVAVLDARMLSGWVLEAARGRVTTVPVRRVPEAGGAGREQEGLF
ncbi:hypothetical protein O1L55_28305 [Streptomyces albulus]|nr:hypothetical protein [Streptomyces noursei]